MKPTMTTKPIYAYRRYIPGPPWARTPSEKSLLVGHYGRSWPRVTMTAECRCHQRRHTCGIYAFKLPDEFAFDDVHAEVELSGVVVEHERGYRAERARIVRLALPDRLAYLREALERRYRVPVLTLDEFVADLRRAMPDADWPEVRQEEDESERSGEIAQR